MALAHAKMATGSQSSGARPAKNLSLAVRAVTEPVQTHSYPFMRAPTLAPRPDATLTMSIANRAAITTSGREQMFLQAQSLSVNRAPKNGRAVATVEPTETAALSVSRRTYTMRGTTMSRAVPVGAGWVAASGAKGRTSASSTGTLI